MPTLLSAEVTPDSVIPVLFFGILGLTGVLIVVPSVLAYQWRTERVARAHIQLKLEMVQRGMSAGQIERVIRAVSVPELVQQGLSTKAIERLLRMTDLSGAEKGLGEGDPLALGACPAKGGPLDPEL